MSVSRNRTHDTRDIDGEEMIGPPIVAASAIQVKEYRPRNSDTTQPAKAAANLSKEGFSMIYKQTQIIVHQKPRFVCCATSSRVKPARRLQRRTETMGEPPDTCYI